MSEEKQIVKEYSNGEVTIVWKPNLCIHSENCFHGLSEVFDPKARPWIDAEGASSKKIMDQIEKCPSGALSFYQNEEGKKEATNNTAEEERMVEVIPNGPLMVHGYVRVKHKDEEEIKQKRVTAFCRCGASGNKPYCDGAHKKVAFKG